MTAGIVNQRADEYDDDPSSILEFKETKWMKDMRTCMFFAPDATILSAGGGFTRLPPLPFDATRKGCRGGLAIFLLHNMELYRVDRAVRVSFIHFVSLNSRILLGSSSRWSAVLMMTTSSILSGDSFYADMHIFNDTS